MEPVDVDFGALAAWALSATAIAAIVIAAGSLVSDFAGRRFNSMGKNIFRLVAIVLLCLGGLVLIPALAEQVFKVATGGKELPTEIQFSN
ncbi:hypothetical protein KY386_03015 [Candidatus Parcubacteria bacterium]|nr:hypothetical protein [Candidatus Parcubacteria bacterium]